VSQYCVADNDCVSLAVMIPSSVPPTLSKIAQEPALSEVEGMGHPQLK
jgi:hypothetical protein